LRGMEVFGSGKKVEGEEGERAKRKLETKIFSSGPFCRFCHSDADVE
jgi:hypothetical protein